MRRRRVNAATVTEPASALKRTLGPVAITLYAVGDILGAGIYALVGKVVGVAGTAAWLSFGVAALLAVFTGFTYAELSSRHPVAAGAAAYMPPRLSAPGGRLPGRDASCWRAASPRPRRCRSPSRAISSRSSPCRRSRAASALLGLMSFVSYRGIQESSNVNVVLTVAETAGLLLVLVVGFWFASGLPAEVQLERVTPDASLAAVLSGATLAFYAYIGFEDTANVAEEVRDASRVLPRAILTAIGVSCLVYVGITVAALLTLPVEQLGELAGAAARRAARGRRRAAGRRVLDRRAVRDLQHGTAEPDHGVAPHLRHGARGAAAARRSRACTRCARRRGSRCCSRSRSR